MSPEAEALAARWWPQVTAWLADHPEALGTMPATEVLALAGIREASGDPLTLDPTAFLALATARSWVARLVQDSVRAQVEVYAAAHPDQVPDVDAYLAELAEREGWR